MATVLLAASILAPRIEAATVPIGMNVGGNQLQRDGVAFYPRGFNMIGLLAPDGCTNPPGMAVKARASFGNAELTVLHDQWSANTVRFQVSQRGLDPQDSIYTSAYLSRVQNGITLARSLGLTVIVSMQDQSNGCGSGHPMPSDATVRSWQTLAPLFATDPYVMYELFNEPQNNEDAAGWAQWKDGGTGPMTNQGAPIVGYQQLVQTVRTAGATNVLLADGARLAERLQGLPLLADSVPSPQIAYAWHPYFFHLSSTSTLTTDQANWDSRTSDVLARAPIIATEWNTGSSSCTADTPKRAADFVQYLQTKNIGLLGHAFDVPNTMVTDLTTWQPTSFTNYGCNVVGPGAGQLVQSTFRTLAQNDPPAKDVTVPTIPGGLSASNITTSGAALSWQSATDNVGVTGYQISRNDSIISTITGTTFQDSGLQPQTAYSYQVAAVDAAGSVSALSPSLAVKTPPDITAPAAPTISAVMNQQQITLSWPAASDSSGIASYAVYRDNQFLQSVSGTTTTFNDSNVTEGQMYAYQVLTTDGAGNSSDLGAPVVITVPDTTAPTAPGQPAVSLANGVVHLSWCASTDNIGVTAYRLSRNGAVIATTTDLSYDDAGPTQGSVYTYVITALDAAGNESPTSSTTAITIADNTPPTTPGQPTLVVLLDGSVQVSWPKVNDNVGVTGYHLSRNGVVITALAGTSYSDIDTVQNANYTYMVTAFDAARNESSASPASTITIPDTTAPSIPTQPTATLQSGAVQLSWAASTDNVGVTSYNVWRNGTAVAVVTGTSYTDTAIAQGTSYSYAVSALDAAGNTSALSTSSNVTYADSIAPTVPGKPTVAVSARSVIIRWAASTDNVDVANYVVKRNGITIATVTTAAYTDSTVRQGISYSYTVTANDVAGNASAASVATSVTVPDTTSPPPPTYFRAIAGIHKVTLRWKASTDNVGITGYEIWRNGVKLTTTTATSFTNAGLTTGVSYPYKVRAFDAAGNHSAFTTSISIKSLQYV